MLLLLIVFVALGVLLTIVVWFLYQREMSAEPLAPASQVQNIFSPDKNLQAVIRSRPDGAFQVEVRRRRVDDSPETGPVETWALVYGPAITSSLEEAVEIANQQVGK
jgi:hypothetical protein